MDVTDLIELVHTGWAIATKDLSTPDLWIWISLVREIGISGWELLHGSSPVRWANVSCTANFSLGGPTIRRGYRGLASLRQPLSAIQRERNP